MKFILLVEGETEDLGVPGFINRWLTKQFAMGSGVGVQTVRFEGWAELHNDAPKRAKRYLTDPAYKDVIAVISLIDLYGPTFYPDTATTAKQRYEWGCEYFHKRVLDYFTNERIPIELAAKYRHFFAVHETEAWLVTRPDLFHKDVREALIKQKNPEEINSKTPPGKLLEQLYIKHVKRAYVKTTSGRNIFPKLDPDSVAEKCPYLRTMFHELRSLALNAGAIPKGDWVDSIS